MLCYCDVNNGSFSPPDVLMVIHHLIHGDGGEGESSSLAELKLLDARCYGLHRPVPLSFCQAGNRRTCLSMHSGDRRVIPRPRNISAHQVE